MIAVDTNILVYAHREDSEWHPKAFERIKALAEGRGAWAIPWPCIHEFLAIATHPSIFTPPTPLALAPDQVDAWLESPSLVLLGEDDGYWEVLKSLLAAGRIVGTRVHDVRIPALCCRHQVREFWTADRPPRVRMVVVSIEPTNPGAQREADGPIWTSIQGSRSSQVVATGEFGGGRSGE